MILTDYTHPVPCYQTVAITRYSPIIQKDAMTLFALVRSRVTLDPDIEHCQVREGSYSIVATTSREVTAKIVMHERGVGKWIGGTNPGWTDGVYIWIRANGYSGEQFEAATVQQDFKHHWLLARLVPNRAVSVAPHFDEHFRYFHLEPSNNTGRIANLLAFCSTL